MAISDNGGSADESTSAKPNLKSLESALTKAKKNEEKLIDEHEAISKMQQNELRERVVNYLNDQGIESVQGEDIDFNLEGSELYFETTNSIKYPIDDPIISAEVMSIDMQIRARYMPRKMRLNDAFRESDKEIGESTDQILDLTAIRFFPSENPYNGAHRIVIKTGSEVAVAVLQYLKKLPETYQEVSEHLLEITQGEASLDDFLDIPGLKEGWTLSPTRFSAEKGSDKYDKIADYIAIEGVISVTNPSSMVTIKEVAEYALGEIAEEYHTPSKPTFLQSIRESLNRPFP